MRRLVRQLRARTGLDPFGAAALADALIRRHHRLWALPNAAAVLGFVGWIALVSFGTAALEDTPFDVAKLARSLGWFAPLAAIFLGGGPAILVGVVAFDRVQGALGDAEYRRAIAARRCPYCGHDRRGLPAADPLPCCPECGNCGLPPRSVNCRRCGYSLQGVPAAGCPARCPECGVLDDLLGPHEAAPNQEA